MGESTYVYFLNGEMQKEKPFTSFKAVQDFLFKLYGDAPVRINDVVDIGKKWGEAIVVVREVPVSAKDKEIQKVEHRLKIFERALERCYFNAEDFDEDINDMLVQNLTLDCADIKDVVRIMKAYLRLLKE